MVVSEYGSYQEYSRNSVNKKHSFANPLVLFQIDTIICVYTKHFGKTFPLDKPVRKSRRSELPFDTDSPLLHLENIQCLVYNRKSVLKMGGVMLCGSAWTRIICIVVWLKSLSLP